MARPILVLNCGSSSIKYQVIDVDDESVSATGLVQKIGEAVGGVDHTVVVDGVEHGAHAEPPLPDHTAALAEVVRLFAEHGPDLSSVVGVAHRVVHGGQEFFDPTVLDDEVIARLAELSGLAPLHNPPAVAGIAAARATLPSVPHVAVFDTGFFHDLPPAAASYAIDSTLSAELGIRRYGFHGSSHDFVSSAAAAALGRDRSELKLIVCHLGNGASISAVDAGRPIETSMGLTPLQGLVMGTRSGDVDPGLIAFLARTKGWDIARIDTELNKHSGMLGLSGHVDMREVKAAIDGGDDRAQLAADVYVHRLVGYLGAYTAHLGGLDAIVFTAGVGENADWIRTMVGDKLAAFGVEIDAAANAVRSGEPRVISTQNSTVTVLVVPTNEELHLARAVAAVVTD